MNNRGLTVGQTIMLAIGIILLSMFAVVIADSQRVLTNTVAVSQQSVTFPAAGQSIQLDGQALVDTLTAINSTNSSMSVPASNFSTSNYVQGTGGYRLTLTNLGGVFGGTTVNLSYTNEPVGFNPDGGSRSIASLILIFFVLAGLAFAALGIRNDWF